jgi:flagellar secretion chaperone FliS
MSFSTEYLESKVLTATPHQLHLMVIDGAIRHAIAGESALLAGDFVRAETQLSRANQCVAELIAGLKQSHFPELVDRLKSVFIFVQRALSEADRRRDPRRVADALSVLRLHRDSWIALGKKLAEEAAAATPQETESGYSWAS